MRQGANKPVAHIYAFGLTWLLCAVTGVALGSVTDVLKATVLAGGVSGLVFFISKMWRKKHKEMPQVMPAGTGSIEVGLVVNEAQLRLQDLLQAKRQMRNQNMVRHVEEIIDISHKIIEKLDRQPQVLSSAKRFFNHYLPTTVKLLTNYIYMERQGVAGGNISATMERIEGTLERLAIAYRGQLDTLFSQTAMDLETDIDVLETLLKQEGLTGRQLQNAAFDLEAEIDNLDRSLQEDGFTQK